MKRHPSCANGSEFADSAILNVAATFCQCLSPIVSKLSTRDKNRNLGQGLLVKHIQELVKTSHGFVCSRHFTLVGRDRQRSINCWLYLWAQKSYKHWTEISRKRTTRLKIYTVNSFPHNCVLSEYYTHLLAPHVNNHPPKISSGCYFKNRHRYLIFQFYGRSISYNCLAHSAQLRPGSAKCHARRPYPRKRLHTAQCHVTAVSSTRGTVVCLRLTVEKDWLQRQTYEAQRSMT